MISITINQKAYELNDGVTIIGRSDDADIMIETGGLSRIHARITINGSSMEIEDLGSKNGTWLNEKRIDSKQTVKPNDTVRLADIQCAIVFPQSPAANKAAAKPGTRRFRKSGVKNYTGPAVIAIILIIGFIAYSNYVPAELKQARSTLIEAEALLQDLEPAGNLETNAETVLLLEQWEPKLKAIPADFSAEHHQAGILLGRIDKTRKAILAEDISLRDAMSVQAAQELCDKTYADYTQNHSQALKAIAALQQIADSHSGNTAGAAALEYISSIQKAETAAERKTIANTRNAANQLQLQDQYRPALDQIESALTKQYHFINQDELNPLRQLKDDIIITARNAFTTAAARAIKQAHTDNCEMIKQNLRFELDAINIPELETDYYEAVRKIDEIYAERMAAARALLEKELAEVDVLLQDRQYNAALAVFKRIAPQITESELLEELNIRRRDVSILAIGKQCIIEHINKEKGIEVDGIGFIQSARDQSIELAIDGAALPLNWGKIRDNEFLQILGLALEAQPDAGGYMAYGLILLNNNKLLQADEYFLKARMASSAIAQNYPGLYEESDARIAARRAEADKAAAARREAQEARKKPAGVPAPKRGDFPYANTGIGGAGGIFAPGVSPVDPDFMLTCSDMSGCYRTDDGGKFWRMIHYQQISSAINCKPFFHPEDINLVYWKGLYSTDKAWNFEPLATGTAPWGSVNAVNHVACSPDADPHVFVGSPAGIWTGKAGASFKRLGSGPSGGFAVLPDGLVYGAAGTNLYRWKAGMDKAEQVTLTGVSGNIKAVAAGGTLKGHVVHIAASGGIFTSIDGCKTWKNSFSNSGVRDLVMAANQTPKAYAWAGKSVFTTDNNGESWKSTFDMASNVDRTWVQDEMKWGYSIMHSGLNCSWNDADRVMMTTQGEFFISENGGKRWRGIVNEKTGNAPGGQGGRFKSIGLEVTTTWDYVFAPDDPTRHYICYTDCGFAYSVDRGQTWSHGSRGCPWGNTFYAIVFDPFEKGRVYAATSSKHDIPGWTNIDNNYMPGGVCISTDYAQSWKPSTSGMPTTKPACGIDVHPDSKPGGNTILFASIYGDAVYRSDDSGATWVKKPGVGRPGNYHLYQISCHQKSGDVFCNTTGNRNGVDFSPNGGLWKSSDKGETWVEITETKPLGWPCNFALHPETPDIIYIAAGTFPHNPQGGVYKTTNGGQSWQHVLTDQTTKGFNNTSFISMNPNDPDNLFFGGSRGLWASSDGGKTWRHVKDIPFANVSRVRIDPLDPETMYVTSFGGGVFVGKTAR